MRMSYEERLCIVKRVASGVSIRQLSKQYSLNEYLILEWVRKYAKYGASALRTQRKKSIPVSLKEKVVRLVLEKSVPLSLVVVDYRISRASLNKWLRQVRESGYESLHKVKRLSLPMGRNPKREPATELERLQAENLRLRAENALLKKVKALVEEKAARQHAIGRGSSTN